MNLIPPLALRLLQCAARGLSLRSPIGTFLDHLLHFNVLELVEAIDFPSMLRALPNLTTIFCPGLFYLHHGLDKLYSLLDPIRSYGPIPRYQKFLETIYSQLLQDPLASRVVPVIYAMFFKPSRPTFSHEALALLLGLAPGVLYRSAAVQGLFGFGLHGEVLAHVIHRWSLEFKVPHSLAILLKTGRVKLQNFHIDDYIHGIHEDLAISCTKYLASYTGPEGLGGWDREPSWYAKRHWSLHLRRAKPSERLFETLRQVDISGHDIELVLEWLEENPNAPEDVLTRWRAAREDPGIISVLTTWEGNKRRLENMEIRCYLDEIFQKWMRHRDAAGMETGSDEDSEF
ncbi:hypothetical protein BD779DRAFT_610928 [Infundibulicybe gibba]|nr:hypothetical protein BD779DRAFT_610928 [Infundibulicybe gibba]